jgi:predicted O-linked N-acetylglucosamine transferase (SPINDLY family)
MVCTALPILLTREGKPRLTPTQALFIPFDDPSIQSDIAEAYSRIAAQRSATRTQRSTNEGKPTIGFISSFFNDHIIAHLIFPLLRNLNRDLFDVFAFALEPRFSINGKNTWG